MDTTEFPHIHSDKLTIARDLEGTPLHDDFGAVNELHQVLQDNPAFIGISVYGSTVKGYSQPGSDLDIKILWDPSKSKKSSFETIQEIENTAKKFTPQLEQKIGKTISFSDASFNLTLIPQELHSENPKALDFFAVHVAPLCRPITGQKITEYRNEIKKELNLLSEEQREELVDKILEVYKREEINGSKKIQRRTNMSELEYEQYISKRMELWKRIVKQLLNI